MNKSARIRRVSKGRLGGVAANRYYQDIDKAVSLYNYPGKRQSKPALMHPLRRTSCQEMECGA